MAWGADGLQVSHIVSPALGLWQDVIALTGQKDGELDGASNTKKIGIAGSAKPVTTYSLDAVISVGYRVNSKAATRFRQWATQTIKAFIEQGYVINEKVLRDSPEKLNKLAADQGD
jgi:hypothetical protein